MMNLGDDSDVLINPGPQLVGRFLSCVVFSNTQWTEIRDDLHGRYIHSD